MSLIVHSITIDDGGDLLHVSLDVGDDKLQIRTDEGRTVLLDAEACYTLYRFLMDMRDKLVRIKSE